MNFRIHHHNRVSFGVAAAAAAKQWAIGWTNNEAAQAANRRAGGDRSAATGIHGVLTGRDRLGTTR